MNRPQTLNHDDIGRRIPHQGSMCLLDTVTAWNDEHISCQANSHRALDHPLRAYGRLGAACGIEYAAQAMAVHGALMAESRMVASVSSVGSSPIRPGYLASMRSVTLHVDRLDTVACPLTVNAERITGDISSVLYSFTVLAGAQILLNGRAIVVLDASATSLFPQTNDTA